MCWRRRSLFCLGAGRPRHLGVFLVRRWMRTIPPYLVALLLISILSRQVGSADFLRYLVYAQNLFRQSNTADYFAVAWSLSVEEWFYIGFPSLLLAAAWLSGAARLGASPSSSRSASASRSSSLRTLFGDLADWGAAVRRVVAFRLDSIGYGFLLYLALDRCRQPPLNRLPGWTGWRWLCWRRRSAPIWSSTELPKPATAPPSTFFRSRQRCSAAPAIVCALRAEAAIHRLPALAWLGRYLGRVSYSTYLFHVILIELIGALLPRVGGFVQLALFLTVLFGFTTALLRLFRAADPRRPAALRDASRSRRSTRSARLREQIGNKPRRQHPLRGDSVPLAVPMHVARDLERAGLARDSAPGTAVRGRPSRNLSPPPRQRSPAAAGGWSRLPALAGSARRPSRTARAPAADRPGCGKSRKNSGMIAAEAAIRAAASGSAAKARRVGARLAMRCAALSGRSRLRFNSKYRASALCRAISRSQPGW